jgi:hypothetical protein
MGKIPKRKGQRINGKGVSVFAAATVIFLLPIVTSIMVDIALKFGDDPKTVDYAESHDFVGRDVAPWTGIYHTYEGDAPIWMQSGDMTQGHCPVDWSIMAAWQLGPTQPTYNNPIDQLGLVYGYNESTAESCGRAYWWYDVGTAYDPAIVLNQTNGIASPTNALLSTSLNYQNAYEGPYPLVEQINGKYWVHLPSCNDYEFTPAIGQTSNCGDNNFKIKIPINDFLKEESGNSIFSFEFRTGSAYVCDDDTLFDFGLVDWTLNFTAWERPVNLAIYSNPIDENFEVMGSTKFYSGTPHSTIGGVEMCQAYIKVEVDLGYVEVVKLIDWKERISDNDVNSWDYVPERWTWLTLEMDNIRRESDGRSFEGAGLYHPFNQGGGFNDTNGDILVSIQANEYILEPVNFILRLELLILGGVMMAGAVASTPLWDPLKGRLSR